MLHPREPNLITGRRRLAAKVIRQGAPYCPITVANLPSVDIEVATGTPQHGNTGICIHHPLRATNPLLLYLEEDDEC